MTHEELFGVIDSYSRLAGNSDAWNALRAVVELHKPMAVYKELCRCETIYPCPTIQAIEKELK